MICFPSNDLTYVQDDMPIAFLMLSCTKCYNDHQHCGKNFEKNSSERTSTLDFFFYGINILSQSSYFNIKATEDDEEG